MSKMDNSQIMLTDDDLIMLETALSNYVSDYETASHEMFEEEWLLNHIRRYIKTHGILR